MPFIITLDGPGGVGKSSLAQLLAQALEVPFLDTGAMYRTLGLNLGAAAADMDDAALSHACAALVFTLESQGLYCNGQAIGQEVRTEKAARLASLVARLPIVRTYLQHAQRSIGAQSSLVAEGRDMGTKVFPQAQCKFFLSARPEVRAQRRFLELEAKGDKPNYQAILSDLAQRDDQDRKRPLDPLIAADDAIIVDTSELNINEVLALLLATAQSRLTTQATQPVQTEALSHIDAQGNMRMVDVGHKAETKRIARAQAIISMNHNTLDLLQKQALPKGDVLAAAKIAGIMAAKRTAELIPMCHPLLITKVDISFTIIPEPPQVQILSEVRVNGNTGVEMEAIVAAQIAAATIYDMAKAVQKDMEIHSVRLLYKEGGKSGTFIGHCHLDPRQP